MNHSMLGALCASVLFAASGAAQAALIDRGGGLIYDTDLNITWLQDANYGYGSSYDTADGTGDGAMTWQNAMDWAANLSYVDVVRGVTYDDWRLPTTLQPDPTCSSYYGGSWGGTGCTGSELGHLYSSELGHVAFGSMATLAGGNGVFLSVWAGRYWSATEHSTDSLSAWFFSDSGMQDYWYKTNGAMAWAVRDGDVAAVPVPAAAWLLFSGLLGLLSTAQRKPK